jgi:hypothetical protein
MKRPRKFLGFILVLLIINTLFFLAWYALDLQGMIKGIVEKQAGKALGGSLAIKSFSVSDQQVFAQDIEFSAADSSLAFNVRSVSVRFNLLKFIFSGFRIRNILNKVEINDPVVSYSLFPKPAKAKVPRPKRKFELPDLDPYFNDLVLHNGRLNLRLDIPLRLGGGEILSVSEHLRNIEISASNDGSSDLRLSAVSAGNGILTLRALLDRGRMVSASGELARYIPESIYHPEIRDFNTELNLEVKLSQDRAGGDLKLDAKAFLWDTRALLMSKYPLALPYLALFSDGVRLEADISGSRVGTSSFSGRVTLADLRKGLSFGPGKLDLNLDLAMIDPALQGIVAAEAQAGGTLRDPVLSLRSRTRSISWNRQQLTDVVLNAGYQDKTLNLELDNAVWQNQRLSLNGSFDTVSRKLVSAIAISPVVDDHSLLQVSAQCGVELVLTESLPHIKAAISSLDLSRGSLQVEGLSGSVLLVPGTKDAGNYLVDLDLASADGTRLAVIGDLLDRELSLSATFTNINPAEIYDDPTLRSLSLSLGGSLDGWLSGDRLVASSKLHARLDPGIPCEADLDLAASYDLASHRGAAFVDSRNGYLNGQALDFGLAARIEDRKLLLDSFSANGKVLLSGYLDLARMADFGFDLAVTGMDSETVSAYYPALKLPSIRGVDLFASYSRASGDTVSARLSIGEVNVSGLNPLSGRLRIHGPPGAVNLEGTISNHSRDLVSIAGSASLNGESRLQAVAAFTDLRTGQLMPDPPLDGGLSGQVSLELEKLLSSSRRLELAANLTSPSLVLPDLMTLNGVELALRQGPDLLTVDTLAVSAEGMGSLAASGALDYNLVSNTFFEGGHKLNLALSGKLFNWLKKSVGIITDASGESELTASIGTFEDQFMVYDGSLRIRDGMLALRDQIEPIRDLEIEAGFDQNRVLLESASCRMGQGRLVIENDFEDDPSSHFFVGFLDLGSFRLRIDEPGIIANIPLFTVPRSLTNVVLKGRNSAFATVKGPFDDMRISAEVLLSNASAVYPPNTDNLLSLIYSFRDAFSRGNYEKSDPAPLPFNLDLMIRFGENIRYTTYPANISIQPGAYLHIIYDGQNWIPYAASFNSDQGTIDFFGTVFQADFLNVNILASQNILSIDGSFYRRAVDGTVITLGVSTDPDNSKPLFDRLNFALSSDNPDDRSVTQMLARLRYNKNTEELSETQQQSLLQDEALNLISDNLNTSILSPFLYPIENRIRRFLRLDNFSVNVGFIQNLFTEYSNDPQRLADYTDMKQFMGDITQFSSSILLNNLSVSMSKYLGSRFFLDYEFSLQEATDLQNRTRIVMSHDTSLRVFLPHQFRLGYTFKYEPQDDRLTHEVMLQRSFRFWGL